ncbi:MAG: hypothetical protein ACE5OO_07920 [Candidatus Bathyarchaeia archaeon]
MGKYFSRSGRNLYIYVMGDDLMFDLRLFPPELNLFDSETAWRINDRVAMVADVADETLDRAEAILESNGFRRRDMREELLENYFAYGDEAVLVEGRTPTIFEPLTPRRGPEREAWEEGIIIPEVITPEVYRPRPAAITLPPPKLAPQAAERRPDDDRRSKREDLKD